jgi:hypothetical protein
VSPSPHLKTETSPVSRTLCFLVVRNPDDGDSVHIGIVYSGSFAITRSIRGHEAWERL